MIQEEFFDSERTVILRLRNSGKYDNLFFEDHLGPSLLLYRETELGDEAFYRSLGRGSVSAGRVRSDQLARKDEELWVSRSYRDTRSYRAKLRANRVYLDLRAGFRTDADLSRARALRWTLADVPPFGFPECFPRIAYVRRSQMMARSAVRLGSARCLSSVLLVVGASHEPEIWSFLRDARYPFLRALYHAYDELPLPRGVVTTKLR